ncbi:MAG: methyltransferase domain-containing protein [Phycisphaerae bacterium]
MKRLISLLLGCSVILVGCASQEANPIIVYQPANENQSDTALNASFGAASVDETQEEVENESYTALNAPVGAASSQETQTEVESSREPDVIFVPTPQDVVDKMLELAEVKKDDLVYDLGCGDGRIVVTASKRFGCKAVGYDIDPERVKESLENVEKNEVGHMVRIEQKDIFTLDLNKADVITLYLLPSLNVKLIPQLEKLKPGSRIVSHDFRMKGVKPDKVVKLTSNEDGSEHKVFLWISPLKKRKIDDTAPVENDSF